MNQLAGGLSPAGFVLHDVTVNHITVINDGWMQNRPEFKYPSQIMLGLRSPAASASTQMQNINFTNSILPTGESGMYSTGGGLTNCVSGAATPVQKYSCWKGTSVFAGNVLMSSGYNGKLPWPSGNFTAATWAEVGFTDFAGANYKLSALSPFVKKGTDGRDPGADITAVNAAISKRN